MRPPGLIVVKMTNSLRLDLLLFASLVIACQPSPPSTAKDTEIVQCQNDAQCLRPWHPGANSCVAPLTCVSGQCIVPASQTGHTNEAVGELRFDRGNGPQSILVEIANDDFERSKGLMCRIDVLQNWGMLFFMPDIRVHRFWMKNTLLALDMLFIDENWTVVGLLTDVPPLNLTGRGIQTPSQYILELKAGEAERLGLFTGLQFEYFAPAQ